MRKLIAFIGEIGAWLALLYAMPVGFYFIALMRAPPTAPDPDSGATLLVDIGPFLPYEGPHYLDTLHWWLYHTALFAGLAGAALWLLSWLLKKLGGTEP